MRPIIHIISDLYRNGIHDWSQTSADYLKITQHSMNQLEIGM